jgi:NAD(P)-dependent dehydrogenase (short-subunit alcohol dehydrogenase family)
LDAQYRGQSFWSVLRVAPRRALVVEGCGVVINVSSGAAANPLVGWSAYCASKAGLSILTRVLAIEESDARGIRVYGFAPGVVDTEMQTFNRANRMNEVGDLKRDMLRPPTESAQIMYFLCTPKLLTLRNVFSIAAVWCQAPSSLMFCLRQ